MSDSDEEFEFGGEASPAAVAQKPVATTHARGDDGDGSSNRKQKRSSSKVSKSYKEDDDDDDDDDDDGPKTKKAKKAANVTKEEKKKSTAKKSMASTLDKKKSKKTPAVAAAAAAASKKVKREHSATISPAKVSSSSARSGATKQQPQPRELKRLDRAERLQYALQSFLWWDAVEPPPGCQWVSMEHAERVWALVEQMRASGVTPTAALVKSLIPFYVSKATVPSRHADAVYKDVDDEDDFARTKALLDYVELYHMPLLDRRHYRAVTNGLLARGDGVRASAVLLRQMERYIAHRQRHKLRPHTADIPRIVESCIHAGALREATVFFTKLKTWHDRGYIDRGPNVALCQTLIVAWINASSSSPDDKEWCIAELEKQRFVKQFEEDPDQTQKGKRMIQLPKSERPKKSGTRSRRSRNLSRDRPDDWEVFKRSGGRAVR